MSAVPPPSLLPRYWIARCPESWFLVGCYRSADQLKWIESTHGPDKKTPLYNVRLRPAGGIGRDGSIAVGPENALATAPQFLILYDFRSPTNQRAFRIGGHRILDEATMTKTGYKKASGDYLCYELDEEIDFGAIDVPKLLADWKKNEPGGKDGTPLFRMGAELSAYMGP